MKETLLNKKIQQIQNDYLVLLKNLNFKDITQDIFLNCIDTINIFWHSHREAIDLFLHYHLEDKSTYLHTGNGSFSLEEKTHYIFVTLGDLHIIDDPIIRLSSTVKFMPNGAFKEKIIRNIKNRVEDVILIFEEYPEVFTILPITTCTGKDLQEVFYRAESIFFSMFNDESLTKEEYLKDFSTLEEVEDALKGHIPQTLIFSDEDDTSIDMKTRFRDFLKTKNNPFAEIQVSEAHAFMGIVISYFTQALTISMMSLTLKATPFIMHFLPFIYFRMIMENFSENQTAKKITSMATYAYLFNTNFDFSRIEGIDFKDYYTFSENFKFVNQLSERLKMKEGMPFVSIPVSELMKDVQEIQASFLNGLTATPKI